MGQEVGGVGSGVGSYPSRNRSPREGQLRLFGDRVENLLRTAPSIAEVFLAIYTKSTLQKQM